MRAQATDPDCAHPPWVGLSLTEAHAWIEQVGGLDVAADCVLSYGRRSNFPANRDRRETHALGLSFDVLAGRMYGREAEDAKLYDHAIVERAAFRGHVTCGGAVRALGCDEWNAILACYPADAPDRDILVVSAQYGAGESEQIGVRVGLSGRRVRQIQDRLLAWARTHLTPDQILAHLDDPITAEAVVRRRPSRAGRKPKAAVATCIAPRFLTLVSRPPSAAPKPPCVPRRRRPRYIDPRQVDFGWGVAA